MMGTSVAGLSFGPNLCGKCMVHALFGKGAVLGPMLLTPGVSCQAVG